MEERKIIFSKRFKKYKFMNSDTESKDDADYDAAISQISDFFEYMRKNRKSVPDEERIANKDKFIKTVSANTCFTSSSTNIIRPRKYTFHHTNLSEKYF